jgi:hypothetical protein
MLEAKKDDEMFGCANGETGELYRPWNDVPTRASHLHKSEETKERRIQVRYAPDPHVSYDDGEVGVPQPHHWSCEPHLCSNDGVNNNNNNNNNDDGDKSVVPLPHLYDYDGANECRRTPHAKGQNVAVIQQTGPGHSSPSFGRCGFRIFGVFESERQARMYFGDNNNDGNENENRTSTSSAYQQFTTYSIPTHCLNGLRKQDPANVTHEDSEGFETKLSEPYETWVRAVNDEFRTRTNRDSRKGPTKKMIRNRKKLLNMQRPTAAEVCKKGILSNTTNKQQVDSIPLSNAVLPKDQNVAVVVLIPYINLPEDTNSSLDYTECLFSVMGAFKDTSMAQDYITKISGFYPGIPYMDIVEMGQWLYPDYLHCAESLNIPTRHLGEGMEELDMIMQSRSLMNKKEMEVNKTKKGRGSVRGKATSKSTARQTPGEGKGKGKGKGK